jgi:hypothetical protein
MYTVTKSGISFDIITTNDEIIMLDEHGKSLTWDKTEENEQLVDAMVLEVTA